MTGNPPAPNGRPITIEFHWDRSLAGESSFLRRRGARQIIFDIVGMLMPNLAATRDWAIAASSSENRCAISTSVLARLIALLNSSMALLRLPL